MRATAFTRRVGAVVATAVFSGMMMAAGCGGDDNPTGGGGGGGKADLRITTAAELAELAEAVNGGTNDFKGKTVMLMNDIDLSRYMAGAGWVPIGSEYFYDRKLGKGFRRPFRGVFDGNGKTISGLDSINDVNTKSNGLFGYICGGTVKNLGVVNVRISGSAPIGGVVGRADSGSSVIKCYSSGSVNSDFGFGVGGVVGILGSGDAVMTDCHFVGAVKGSYQVGGVAGCAWNSDITNCYFSGVVTGGNDTSFYSIESQVGGVVGYADSANITNCYADGRVNGTNGDAGGIVGQFGGFNFGITNCYSATVVDGNGAICVVGGVVGRLMGGSVANCYSADSVVGRSENISGIVIVGGLVGVIPKNSNYARVANNVALNPSVTWSGISLYQSGGRVIGNIVSEDATWDNLYAFDGMAVRGTILGGLEPENGTDITVSAIRADGTIGGLFTKSGGWTTANGKLPGFGKAVDLPAHLK